MEDDARLWQRLGFYDPDSSGAADRLAILRFLTDRGATVEDLDRDPYPVYARLRAETPVAYVPAVNVWMVTRWALVMAGSMPPILRT